jgi:hypothetical protein
MITCETLLQGFQTVCVVERINELKRLMQEEQAMYLKLKEEVAQIKAGQVDDRLIEMCQQIEE